MVDDPTPPPQPDPAPAPAPAADPAPSSAPEERFVPAARFDAVVGQKYEAIRKAEGLEARARELEGRLAQYEQQRIQAPPAPPATSQTPPLPDPPGTRTFQGQVSPAELDRLADLRARQMRFNERCNESVATGRKAFQDFDAKVDALRSVAPTVDAQGRPMLPETLVSAALATGRGHEVLYALGSDQSEADRIMSIADPTSQAVAVAQYAAALKGKDATGGDDDAPAPARRSAEVPAPIRQVVGGSRKVSVKDMDLADPALPIEEFMRRRDEEAKIARRANGRFR